MDLERKIVKQALNFRPMTAQPKSVQINDINSNGTTVQSKTATS
jgi:hypothetical protein